VYGWSRTAGDWIVVVVSPWPVALRRDHGRFLSVRMRADYGVQATRRQGMSQATR